MVAAAMGKVLGDELFGVLHNSRTCLRGVVEECVTLAKSGAAEGCFHTLLQQTLISRLWKPGHRMEYLIKPPQYNYHRVDLLRKRRQMTVAWQKKIEDG